METMRSGLLLVILSLMVTLHSCQSSCEEQEPHRPTGEKDPGFVNVPRELLKRYSDVDYDSFVGLMGRRSSGKNELPVQKRDMHDVFVGLMGRRSSQSVDARQLRKENAERRAGFVFNRCKPRFRRGV